MKKNSAILEKEEANGKNTVINLNPVFVDQNEYSFNSFSIIEFPLYIIVIVQILIIIFVLYYFFYEELYFIYNSFKPKSKELDLTFINKISDLKTYQPICNSNGNILLTNTNGTILAKNFDDTIVKFISQSECNEFLQNYF